MNLFDILGGFEGVPLSRKPRPRCIAPIGRIYLAVLAGWTAALLAAFVFPETTGASIYYVVEAARSTLWGNP